MRYLFQVFMVFCLCSTNLIFAKSDKTSESDPYQRLLLQGSRLTSLANPKKVFRLKKDHIVWVKNIFGNENFVHVLSKSGLPLYKTQLKNTTSFNKVNEILPKINPLKIHQNITLDQEDLPQAIGDKWSSFATFSIEQSSSKFYSDLFSGSQTRLGALRAQLKHYYIYNKLPVHMGVQLSAYRQGWSDENSSDATIFNASWGPTFMTSFWRQKNKVYNLHLSFFRSITNKVTFNEQEIGLTSIGYQLQLEKEFLVNGKPLLLGAQYRHTKHNVDNISAANQFTDEGNENTFGLSVGYRFDWTTL